MERPLDTAKARCGPLLRRTDLAGVSPSTAGTRGAFSAVCRASSRRAQSTSTTVHAVSRCEGPLCCSPVRYIFRDLLRRVKRNRATEAALKYRQLTEQGELTGHDHFGYSFNHGGRGTEPV